MRSNQTLILILVLAFCCSNSLAQARTPDAAVRYYVSNSQRRCGWEGDRDKERVCYSDFPLSWFLGWPDTRERG